jgi:hypothetical protein
MRLGIVDPADGELVLNPHQPAIYPRMREYVEHNDVGSGVVVNITMGSNSALMPTVGYATVYHAVIALANCAARPCGPHWQR